MPLFFILCHLLDATATRNHSWVFLSLFLSFFQNMADVVTTYTTTSVFRAWLLKILTQFFHFLKNQLFHDDVISTLKLSLQLKTIWEKIAFVFHTNGTSVAMVTFRNFQLAITDVLRVSWLAISQGKQLLCWVLQLFFHEVPRYNSLSEFSTVIQANASLQFQVVTKTFSGDNDFGVQIFLQQSCQVRAPNTSKEQHSQAVVVCAAVPGRVPHTSFETDLPRSTSSGSVSKRIASPQSSG